MTLIGWDDYFKGRDKAYAEALTLEIGRNARRTIEVVNAVLAAMAADGVDLDGVHVASGWRPPAVNDATQNHAEHSKHLTAEACDLADLPDRRLARWALANRKALWDAGVRAMERPQWTPTWLHVQTRAPDSGRFVYIPSSAPPIAAVLPGEVEGSRLT
jgi:hypothetical protein